MSALEELKNAADALDAEIVDALSRRVILAEKEQQALAAEAKPIDSRHKEIFSRVIALAPLAQRDVVYNVYERILGGALGLIETVSRAVIIRDGKVLLCRSKGADKYYLPGGHIDFGETAAQALEREILEETSLKSKVGEFLGVVENSFLQHGKKHCEINLVYRAEIEDGEVRAAEDWIEFDWVDVSSVASVELLPVEMKGFLS